MRAHDWSTSPLGPWEEWPLSLRTTVALMLASKHGMMLAWGPQLTLLYNDAYAPFLGGKHPAAIGRPFAEVWSDIWSEVEPLVDQALSGDAVWFEDYHLVVERNGYPEDTWWQFSYSPARGDDGGICGILNVTSDMTGKVLTQRRQAFRIALDARLRDVADPAVVVAITSEALGEQLRVAQVGYAEVEPGGDTVLIEREWNNGAMASNARRHRLDDFGPAFIADLRLGRTVAVDVVRLDPRTSSPVALATFDRASIQAFLDVPIVKARKLLAVIALHSKTPRAWSSEDIALVEEIAEQTWAAAERAQAEASLREAEERYLALFNAIEQGFCTIEVAFDEHDRAVDYRFLEVSPSFERQTGIVDGEGRWMKEIAPDQDSQWFEIYGRVALTGEPARFEDYSTPLERWWDVYAFRISGARRIAVVFHDITHQKRAEQAQRETETQLLELNDTLERQVQERTAERDRMWDTSPDLMVQASLEGVYERANRAWTAILGYEPSEVEGRTAADFTHSDDLDPMFQALATVQADTLPGVNLRFRHKDGGYRWIQWVAAPSAGLIFALGRDVTAAVEAEARLRETEEALRQSQKMEAVGQLTGGVAHDFNNLLTIIRSSIDLLRRPGLPDDRRTRYLDAASDTVDRAAKLTSQLLAFARRQSLKPETFDVVAKVNKLAEMLDTVTGSRIRLVTELPDKPCHVRADVSQFETALVNLAVNARDAMDGEGVLTLTARCHSPLPAIRGHAGSAGHFTAIRVSDTGCGIPADLLPKIFEPFYTTKEVGKGTGLGLSQVFGFAKQSGGDVEVMSVVGEGSSFTLYLPEVVAEERAELSSAHDERGTPGGAGQCVLIVEDNVEVGRFCSQILQDLGYRTALVTSAEEALEKLGGNGNGFDAVFSDVVMPGMGGVALAEHLRLRMPDLPVVLTSGYSDVLARENEHGFELLHKPYSAERLARILQRVMP